MWGAIEKLEKKVEALENETGPIQDGVVYMLKVRQKEIAEELQGWLLTAEVSGMSGFGRDTIRELTKEVGEIEEIIGRMK
jgi:hypothetical protein